MASGEIAIIPGTTIGAETLLTPAKLNELAKPIARVAEKTITAREIAPGAIGADQISVDLSAQLGVPDNSVTEAKIVPLAVSASKLAAQAVTAEKASPDLIHGQTELTASPADADEFFLWDASANGGAGGLARVAASKVTGSVVQTVIAEFTTVLGVSAAIPVDDSIPQITEGTELLTASITPKSTANRIVVMMVFYGATTNPVYTAVVAAFRNSEANALVAGTGVTSNGVGGVPLPFGTMITTIDSPASITAVTYRMRVGPSGGSLYANANTSGNRLLGGAMRCSIVLQEIKP